MSIARSQLSTGVAVCIAALFLMMLPHPAAFQSEVCSGPELSGIIEATTPESQLIVAEDILQKIAPDLHSLISTGSSGDASTRLNTAYTRLAERFAVRATRAGYTNFVEALTAISVAQAEACSSSDLASINSSTVADLVKAFDREFSLPDSDLDRLRSLFGKLLCIDSVGGVYMRMYASMMGRDRGKRQAPGCPPGTSCACPAGGLSDVVCSCQFFRCLDPDDHLKPIFGFSPTLAQCLAFVIDTTGSMSSEIATARRIILEFLQSEEQIGILGCYLLVPFNDRGSPASSVGPILSANAVFLDELQAFYNAVNALTASGGGDAPEYALDGMLQGLTFQEEFTDPDGNVFKFDIMSPGSQMIVITDATSKRPEIKDMVIQNAIDREVCIHFFLSRNPVSDGVYPDVATGTSGTLIPNFADWQLAQFVAEYSNNPCAYSTGVRGKRQAVPPTPTPSRCQSFEVSTLAINLKLSTLVSDDSFMPITLTIERPNGTVTLRTANPIEGAAFDVYTEGLPPPGVWTICTSAGIIDTLSVTVQNSLDLTVRYKSDSTGEISDLPPPACSTGSIVVITTRRNIRSPKLSLIGRDGFTVDFPVNCSGAVLVSSPGVIFPPGRFTYRFEGIDGETGIAFEHDTGKEVFIGDAVGHSLRYAGDTNVEISGSATKSLVYILENNDRYDVSYDFSVGTVDGFSATVNPSIATLVPPGGAVSVQVNVQLTGDSLPDGSSHTITLEARDGCKVLSASTTVTVSRCALDCQNGGKCVTINYRGIELTRCQCPPGFSGTQCQIGGAPAASQMQQHAQRQNQATAYNQQQQWKMELELAQRASQAAYNQQQHQWKPVGGQRGQRQNRVYNQQQRWRQ